MVSVPWTEPADTLFTTGLIYPLHMHSSSATPIGIIDFASHIEKRMS